MREKLGIFLQSQLHPRSLRTGRSELSSLCLGDSICSCCEHEWGDVHVKCSCAGWHMVSSASATLGWTWPNHSLWRETATYGSWRLNVTRVTHLCSDHNVLIENDSCLSTHAELLHETSFEASHDACSWDAWMHVCHSADFKSRLYTSPITHLCFQKKKNLSLLLEHALFESVQGSQYVEK